MSAVYLTFVYHYACSILITEFSHLNDLHFGLFQTLWADAQPCKIWSADALVGLRLLCVCTEWYTSYIHFYLVKRRPHLHPDRENCMLKILKCQLQVQPSLQSRFIPYNYSVSRWVNHIFLSIVGRGFSTYFISYSHKMLFVVCLSLSTASVLW